MQILYIEDSETQAVFFIGMLKKRGISVDRFRSIQEVQDTHKCSEIGRAHV